MNSNKTIILLAAALTLPVSADTIGLTISQSPLAGSPGDTLTFDGTVTNNSGSDLFINGASLNLAGFDPNDSDLTDFILNVTGPLSNGTSIGPVDFFTVTIPNGFAAGPYLGTLAVQGGATGNDDALLGTTGFEVDVNGPTGNAPEPAPAILVGFGLLWVLARSVIRGANT